MDSWTLGLETFNRHFLRNVHRLVEGFVDNFVAGEELDAVGGRDADGDVKDLRRFLVDVDLRASFRGFGTIPRGGVFGGDRLRSAHRILRDENLGASFFELRRRVHKQSPYISTLLSIRSRRKRLFLIIRQIDKLIRSSV